MIAYGNRLKVCYSNFDSRSVFRIYHYNSLLRFGRVFGSVDPSLYLGSAFKQMKFDSCLSRQSIYYNRGGRVYFFFFLSFLLSFVSQTAVLTRFTANLLVSRLA